MRRFLAIYILLFALNCILSAQSFRPVPHQVLQDGKKTVNVSKGVVLADPKGVFKDACSFLNRKDKGLVLTVDFGGSAADGLKQVSGSYRLDVTPKAITIIGYDEKGAFYGLHTLRKLIETSDAKHLPCCTVTDWPDSNIRGFAEFNTAGPWSGDFRHSMIALAADLKMGTYVYAPKHDPYVSGSDWYMPYLQSKADDLKKLVEECSRNRIDFVWCIRPNEEFTWSDSDYTLLRGKFEMMHYLGVRSFGILFDDIPCSEDMEEKKRELIEKLNEDFIAKKKGVGPLLTSLEGYYVPEYGRESVKLGMYGTADKGWNSDAYDPMTSLRWAAEAVAPDVAEAYVTFALHSDAVSDVFGTDQSVSVFESPMDEYVAVENAPSVISGSANNALYTDLKPWLEEFGKLGSRCRRILECVDCFEKGDIPGFWSTYASNLMSDDDRTAYMAHPSGTARLYPYYEKMMKELAAEFDKAYKGKVEYTYIPGEGIQTYIAPHEATRCHLILDNPQKREVIVRLSDAKGQYTAEFCIELSYFEFEMKEDAVKVEVIGDVPVFETVFVN